MFSLEPTINKLARRILDISYRNQLAHLGSCLSMLPIVYNIYQMKRPHEPFILSAGHAGLALYVVLEEFEHQNAEVLFHKHGVHPNRDIGDGLYCSSGSLGCGLPIAIGMALADCSRSVYCIISDGECAEGSIWESLRFIHDIDLQNLFLAININGYSALSELDTKYLRKRLYTFWHGIYMWNTPSSFFSFLNGLEAHYHIMTKEEYEEAIRQLTI